MQIPEDIVLEVDKEENLKENEKDNVQKCPVRAMPPINLLDITQVKLRDTSKPAKSSGKPPSPTSGGKPGWLAELNQKQAKRKSLDLIEEAKKQEKVIKSSSENIIKDTKKVEKTSIVSSESTPKTKELKSTGY